MLRHRMYVMIKQLTWIAAAATLLLTSMVGGVAAQRVAANPTPGWIGITFDITTRGAGAGTLVVITEVMPGSPAEDADLRAGDRVLAINDLDSPRELSELAERLRLSAGDAVTLEIQRDGRRYRIRLQAAVRPRAYTVIPTMDYSRESDAVVEKWVRAMESLRLRLVQERVQTPRIVTPRADGKARLTVVVGDVNVRAVTAPFEFFIFRGEAHDSLRQEMVELNEVLSQLAVRIRERGRELGRAHGVRSEVRLMQDGEFKRLQIALDQATVRSTGLRTAMAEAARTTAGLEYSRLAPEVRSAASVGNAPPRATGFRPLTPYLLGRNRVAGAEVANLQPRLAEYFEVEGGVLVLDVAPGTPASIAGILPGDVITKIDQVGVRSVEDLRFGVSRAGETVPIALIRQGTSIQVLLRR